MASTATMNTTTKRNRTPSQSSGGSSNSLQVPSKAARLMPDASLSSIASGSSDSASTVVPGDVAPIPRHPLICNLPPTCDRKPTPIANTNELERHYATHHAHVCEVKGCRCVFPEARLLELHQTECHDPIAALRKDRGDKIFQCHIPAPACGRFFATPKARRLHLIQSHSYPKEYFFAVTNKGVGGLLRKWGDGASLIRKEWKPRDGSDGVDDDEDGDEDPNEDEQNQVDQTDEDDYPADLQATPRMGPRATIHSPPSSISSKTEGASKGKSRSRNHSTTEDPSDISALTSSMDSLNLVPNSVRFGRGGKAGGFAPRRGHHPRGHISQGFRGRGSGLRLDDLDNNDVMDVDVHLIQGSTGPVNLGSAGRGRAGISSVHRGGSRERGRGRVAPGHLFNTGGQSDHGYRGRGRGQRGGRGNNSDIPSGN